VIPEKIKLALCILAAEATKIDLFPVDTGRAIVEEKVGPLVTKWASPVIVPQELTHEQCLEIKLFGLLM